MTEEETPKKPTTIAVINSSPLIGEMVSKMSDGTPLFVAAVHENDSHIPFPYPVEKSEKKVHTSDEPRKQYRLNPKFYYEDSHGSVRRISDRANKIADKLGI